jgi:hypothetical protein
MLEKLAKQLVALDEATLTSLWDQYHDKVQRFEPTKRWEEAALILAMIQAVRWKNQLFNVKWDQQRSPAEHGDRSGEGREDSPPARIRGEEDEERGETGSQDQDKGRIIPFRPFDEGFPEE